MFSVALSNFWSEQHGVNGWLRIKLMNTNLFLDPRLFLHLLLLFFGCDSCQLCFLSGPP